MQSALQTAPNLIMKLHYSDGSETVIGYASDLTFGVTQGQKVLLGVDSPFPQEIAQGAAPSLVTGSVTLYVPKNFNPEGANWVPYRLDNEGNPAMISSIYMNIRLYNRSTNTLVFSADQCKIKAYTLGVMSRQVVRMNLQFDGMYLTPGVTY